MKYKIVIGILILAVAGMGGMRYLYVEDSHFPDRTDNPSLPESALVLVAELDFPPGNVAVSSRGEVFFTFHPEGNPPYNLARLVNGKAVPWPSDETYLQADIEPVKSAYSVRIDNQQRLWVLDNYPARLLAFDLSTEQLISEFIFKDEVFGLLSHANDFQVSTDNRYIFISVDGLFDKQPGLVIYDIDRGKSWKRLVRHPSTLAANFEPVVQGREMTIFGLFTVNPGVDGIALSRDSRWLYYAAFGADYLYRVDTQKLTNPELSDQQLEPFIEKVGLKTMTDGMTSDLEGNIYLSDIENSAIVRMNPSGELETLLKTEQLRWPDGFSFGEDNWLYITCSSLHQVIGVSNQQNHAPFHIYKFKPGPHSPAGH